MIVFLFFFGMSPFFFFNKNSTMEGVRISKGVKLISFALIDSSSVFSQNLTTESSNVVVVNLFQCI